MINFKEQTYESNLPIKYIFEKSITNSDFLVIVFSELNEPGTKNKNIYSCMQTIANINCNKLFIFDDYGPKGCYYIGEKLNYDVETSVQALISYIARLCSVKQENIICTGYSEGGSAALYFGLKYNYGHIITGAPQTRIADYISVVCPETTQYMLGNDENTATLKDELNNIIFKQLSKPILTDLHILSSKNDLQYSRHIVPLVDVLKSKNNNYELVIDDNITNHKDIAKFFPAFLTKTLNIIMFDIESVEASISNDHDSITIDVDLKKTKKSTKKISYQYIFKLAEQHSYISFSPSYTFTPKTLGSFFCYVTVLVDNKKALTIYLGEKVIDKNRYKLNGYKFFKENDTIIFSLDIDTDEHLQYAFYLYKNWNVIQKTPYSDEKQIVFPCEDNGNYMVTYFIKSNDDGKIMCKSDILKVD